MIPASLRQVACASLLVAIFPAAAPATKTVELVLDASGSMNAKLPGGETRIAAAKQAVAKLVGQLAPDTVLAFRAYGHQSPREKHDCDDTALLVPFAAASGSGAGVLRAAAGLKAQGYTPISRVIRLAAADLGKQAAGERVILLVSDGKETCDADPCATARALKAADASLVVHAIGFEVDSAARGELACLAAATGGGYFDASGVDGLVKALGMASVQGMAPVKFEANVPGNLEIKNASPQGHDILDAITGAKVDAISSFQRQVRVPAGIYNVTFGKGLWRGVEVRANGLTVLEPATLVIENAMGNGHSVRDSETGAEIINLSSFLHRSPLLPGLYDVEFGGTVWANVRLDGGKTTTLDPGVIVLDGASGSGHAVYDAGGRKVADLSSFGHFQSLVPGSYTIELGGRRVPFTLAEGQRVTLSAK